MSEQKNGKGDINRPKTVSYEEWAKNYERIFKKEKQKWIILC